MKLSIWESNTKVERGYDPDQDFFTSEVGSKSFKLFGMTIYKKVFDSNTKEYIITDKEPKRKKNATVGFKK